MARHLRAAQATVSGISQTIDDKGKIIAYEITVAIRYIDDEGNTVTTVNEVVDAWPNFNEQERSRLQAMQEKIVATVAKRYLD